MVLSQEAILTWVTLRNVPPQLISLKGISWISSKIGRIMSRFVREGLSVKVCILCDASALKPTELVLIIGTDEVKIEIEYYSGRSYESNKSIWGIKSTSGSWVWKQIVKLREHINGNITWNDEGVALWDGEELAKYKVSTVWNSIRRRRPAVDWHDLIWKTPTILGNSFLCWLVISDRLSTKDRVAAWSATIDLNCFMCDDGVDCREHIFAECVFSKQVLKGVMPTEEFDVDWDSTVRTLAGKWSGSSDSAGVNRLIWCAAISHIWRERCKRMMTGRLQSATSLVENIKEEIRCVLYRKKSSNVCKF
ncbi:hypothetical protein LINPERPRIM_LOCUS21803 [Linum perenne]